MKNYFTYIITNKVNTVLYTGFTNNLKRRIYEHKEKIYESFSKRYNVNKLVYYEIFNTPLDAITREKQIKAGSRKKKLDLINAFNPDWEDLYESID